MHDNPFELWITSTLNKEYFMLSLVEIALEVFESCQLQNIFTFSLLSPYK